MRRTLHYRLIMAALAAWLLAACSSNTTNTWMDQDTTLATQEAPVTIDDTTVQGLVVYYPLYSRIAYNFFFTYSLI